MQYQIGIPQLMTSDEPLVIVMDDSPGRDSESRPAWRWAIEHNGQRILSDEGGYIYGPAGGWHDGETAEDAAEALAAILSAYAEHYSLHPCAAPDDCAEGWCAEYRPDTPDRAVIEEHGERLGVWASDRESARSGA